MLYSKKRKNTVTCYVMMLCVLFAVGIYGLSADAASKLKLNYSKYTLTKDSSFTLKAQNSGGSSVSFQTSNSYVATVSTKGKVKAKSPGVCNITVKCGAKKAVCKITVPQPGIQLKADNISMYKGYTYRLNAKSTVSDKITYQSSDPTVVKISKKGTISAIDVGTAVVCISSGGYKKNVYVKVSEAPAFHIRNKNITLYTGDSYVTMDASEVYDTYYALYETDLENNSYSEQFSNVVVTSSIISGQDVIKSGNLTSASKAFYVEALKPGTAVVKYTMKYKVFTSYGKSSTKTKTCNVTVQVKNPETGYDMEDKISIGANRAAFYYNPLLSVGDDSDDDTGIDDDNYTYASDNAAVAKVEAKTGIVTGVSAGSAVITATPTKEKDSKGNALSVKKERIQVISPYLNKSKLTIYIGNTATLQVKDASTADKTLSSDVSVIWSLDNTDATNNGIVAVNGGKVIGLSEGNCKVNAKVGGQLYSCDVTVKGSAYIKSSMKEITLAKGDTKKVKVYNAGNSAVLYTSSNEKIASVSSAGKIAAKNKTGYCYITYQCNGTIFVSRVNVISDDVKQALTQTQSMLKKWKFSAEKRMEKGYYDSSSLVWKAFPTSKKASMFGNGKDAPSASDQCKYMASKGKVMYFGVLDQSELLPGDLVFYNTSGSTKEGSFLNIDHVAMYKGKGTVCETWNRAYGEKSIVAVARLVKK